MDLVDLSYLQDLRSVAGTIKSLLVYDPLKNPDPIAHYTDLNSLKALVQKPSFRLYNAAYMSDPEEGKTLSEILKNIYPNLNEDTGNFLSGGEHSPSYVGSFVKTKKDGESEDEKLFLWRTYGKHMGQEAGGACLHFDISQFLDHPVEQLEDTYSVDSKHRSMLAASQKEYIYKVAYESDAGPNSGGKLSSQLEKLAEALGEIGKQGWSEKNLVHRLAREILDEIRFLFKADHYRGEEELRMVKILHPDDKQSENIEADNDLFPPRFYVEAPFYLQLKKVILGPQARGFPGWKWWIEENNSELEVKKSDIEYGGDYT